MDKGFFRPEDSSKAMIRRAVFETGYVGKTGGSFVKEGGHIEGQNMSGGQRLQVCIEGKSLKRLFQCRLSFLEENYHG